MKSDKGIMLVGLDALVSGLDLADHEALDEGPLEILAQLLLLYQAVVFMQILGTEIAQNQLLEVVSDGPQRIDHALEALDEQGLEVVQLQ
jgi:hypothetical protein